MNNLWSQIITVAYTIDCSVRAIQSLGLKRLESKQKNEAFENTQAKKIRGNIRWRSTAVVLVVD